MARRYVIVSQELGRGPLYKKSFSKLWSALKYVRSQWQGVDYVDGSDGFHTDYSTFRLRGFSLRDIGVFGHEDDGCRTYRFFTYEELKKLTDKNSFRSDAVSLALRVINEEIEEWEGYALAEKKGGNHLVNLFDEEYLKLKPKKRYLVDVVTGEKVCEIARDSDGTNEFEAMYS